MSEIKPTPGPLVPHDREKVTSIPLKAIDCERLGISVCFVNGHRETEAKANAILIYEAFNVHHDTGLSPVQLVEQRDELLQALQDLMAWQVKNVKVWHNGAYDQASRVVKRWAALAKCEGVGNDR